MRLEHPHDAVATDVMPAKSDTGMSDASLAANRARGRIDLSVESDAGVTRRRRVHESGSLRVRFPGAASNELEAVLINTAGGMTGGDAFDIRVSVGANARAIVTSAAAEKIYRSLGPHTLINLTIDVAAGGTLFWLPQETILFDGAALSRSIEVDLAATARLLLFEPLVFGRTGMGETVNRGAINDRWRIRREGRLIYGESTRLGGAISQALSEPAVANGGAAVATALLVPGDEPMLDAVRAMSNDYRGEVGASAWNGHAVLRFCARDGADLRHDITCAARALRAAPLPRLWIN